MEVRQRSLKLQKNREGFRKGWGGMFGGGIYTGSRDKALGYSGHSAHTSRWQYPGPGMKPVIVKTDPTPGMLLKVSVALGRVFVGAVAGINHTGVNDAGKHMGRTRGRVPDDGDINAHGLDIAGRVLQGFALG